MSSIRKNAIEATIARPSGDSWRRRASDNPTRKGEHRDQHRQSHAAVEHAARVSACE